MEKSGLGNLRILSGRKGNYLNCENKVNFTSKSVNINRLVEDVIQTHLLALSLKKLSISFLPGLFSFEAIVRMDEHKLRVILDALLDHAIEHTQEGFVQLGYLPYAGSLDFFVRDSSIQKYEPALRSVFVAGKTKESVEKPIRQNYSLKIARTFIRLMGGRMKILTKKDSGTLVTFSVPCLSIS